MWEHLDLHQSQWLMVSFEALRGKKISIWATNDPHAAAAACSLVTVIDAFVLQLRYSCDSSPLQFETRGRAAARPRARQRFCYSQGVRRSQQVREVRSHPCHPEEQKQEDKKLFGSAWQDERKKKNYEEKLSESEWKASTEAVLNLHDRL